MEKIKKLLQQCENKLDEEFEDLQRSEIKKGFLRGSVYVGIVCYLEIIFHIVVFQKIDVNVVNGLLTSVTLGIFLTVITGLFHETANRWIGRITMFLITAYYMIQTVYYSVFQRFLSLYSVGVVGTDVLDYSSEILTAIFDNLVVLLLLLFPVVFLFVFKKIRYIADRWCIHSILIASGLIVYIGFLISLRVQGNDLYSAYDLYHFHWVQEMGVEKLGLINTAANDLKSLTAGHKELELEAIAIDELSTYVDSDHLSDETNSIETEKVISEIGAEEEGNTKDSNSLEVYTNKENQAAELSGDTNIEPSEETVQAEKKDGKQTGQENETDVAEERELVNATEQNIIHIDFEQLVKEEDDEIIRKLHSYFSVQPPTNQNEYTGMFEDYNLIMLTAEGFSPWAVDEKITPTLYRLINEGFVFENFYTPLWWCSTSDGEYVACTSTIPKSGVTSMYVSGSNDMPFCLGNQFSKLDYRCYAYHNHTYTYYHRDVSHPNMGYHYKGIGNGLEVKKTWPESDLEMMEKTIPEYINDDQFHVYYMTVSGHMNYTFIGNSMAHKNRDAVKDLPYSEEAKSYIACNVELDLALEYLIEELVKAGVAEKTVIALSSDHYPYGLEKDKIDEIAGYEVEENFELYKNHFILWNIAMEEPIVVEEPCSSLDILPTLSNLFGLEYDSRLLMGQDIFSDAMPLVMLSNRSFITDRVMYNSTNGKLTNLEGVEISEDTLPEGYISTLSKIVKNKFSISKSILEQNYYSYLKEYLKPSMNH